MPIISFNRIQTILNKTRKSTKSKTHQINSKPKVFSITKTIQKINSTFTKDMSNSYGNIGTPNMSTMPLKLKIGLRYSPSLVLLRKSVSK